jgi:hypothetical protein
MDIEGAEWEALDAAEVGDLGRIAQLLCEFHGFSNALLADWRERSMRVMAKLNSVFQVVHVHGNNWEPLHVIANVPIPEVIEVTYVSRSMYRFAGSTEICPTPLDRPNDESRPDIFLGSMQFADVEHSLT